MSVLIYTDTINGKPKKSSLEAIHYGSKVAQLLGTNAVALVVNSNENLAELGKYGASKVLKITNDKLNSFDPQLLTAAIAQAANSAGAKVVIFAHDSTGKSLASRLSARSKAGLVSGATSLPTVDGGNFTVRKNVFSGKAFTDINILTDEKIISLMPNSFPVVATDASAEVADFAADLSGVTSTLVVKEVNRASAAGVAPLPEAELVVSAGRGMKGPENWGLIEDLAKSIGATTACSRPVSDIGWRPHHEHVGQTGLAIRPNLYIAIGISGAIQHLAGVNQSKVIVVINKDPEAPFFKAADYGIVGDAFEIVPKLTEAFKNFKASHN
jgi:electron transfer flavoprotein alpha subunit